MSATKIKVPKGWRKLGRGDLLRCGKDKWTPPFGVPGGWATVYDIRELTAGDCERAIYIRKRTRPGRARGGRGK